MNGEQLPQGPQHPRKRGRPKKNFLMGAAGPATLVGAGAGPGVKRPIPSANAAVFSPPEKRRLNQNSGSRMQPRVLQLSPGEDIAARIFLESQAGPRTAVAVIAANGSVASAKLRDPSGAADCTITHEGRYELLSLTGSFVPVDDDAAFVAGSPAAMPRTGALSVSLASSSGTIVGGGVAGKLLAASHVQVVLTVFEYSPKNSPPVLSLPGSAPKPASGAV